MIIDNVLVYTEDKEFVKGGIVLENDTIKSVYKDSEKIKVDNNEIIDGNGAFAIPGLIDLHFHGCKGDDFCDAGKEAIENIAKYECSVGVTSIAPATMTLPVDELENVLSSKNSLIDDVNTIVTDSQDYGGTKLFSYVNDNVINVECPVTSDKYTYSDDFRQRCFQTALAYTNIEFNMTGVCNPDDEKELWNEEIKSKSTALTSYMKNSKMFTKCSISQADKRIREFMAADYSYKQNRSYVSLDITGAQETARFIVRLRTGEVENVSGAVCTKVEKGVYLITAQSKHVEMTIKTE